MPDAFKEKILLRRFLTIMDCPDGWEVFDLYKISDANVTFYIGQSDNAFYRVWEHLKGGIHGHAILGRFILANWPRSGSFDVELMQSMSLDFADLNHISDPVSRRLAAERTLIEKWQPCLNVTLNQAPHAIPAVYAQPNAPIKWVRSFRRMLREASFAAQKDANLMEWDED